MSYARGVLLTALVLIALLITSPLLSAQATRTVQDGVFSDAQATRGDALYAQRCAGCHGSALAGASAPALTGDLFTNKFRMEPLSALFIQIRYAMPPGAVDSATLTDDESAHILKNNGFPSGKTDFTAAAVGFPDVLSTLTNPDLLSLLHEYDATPDAPSGSAAVDWSVLSQRLHFIADFFRGYQEDPSLFERPFDPTRPS